MEVKEAIEKARRDEGVRKLTGYFLCSCFACLKDKKDKITEWTLLFYNPRNNKVIDCFVNSKFVTIGEETPPLAEVERPDFNDISVGAEDALDSAAKKFSKSTINVLVTLHKNPAVWTINFISGDMMATTFDIDTKTGKILRQEETSLIRKL